VDKDKDRECRTGETHELLQVLPILPIEASIGLPDPVPSGVMPCPGREEDDGIIGLNWERKSNHGAWFDHRRVGEVTGTGETEQRKATQRKTEPGGW